MLKAIYNFMVPWAVFVFHFCPIAFSMFVSTFLLLEYMSLKITFVGNAGESVVLYVGQSFNL